MKVYLNKKLIEVDEAIALSKMLADNGIDGKGAAVAVNRKVVPRGSWPGFELADGMEIIVINATCGG